uniref:Chalcone/stilbene synthase C-terminal domain-containing protein n=1 Tax=Triticum urartu TaxID=4572 RepID=A0A8R7QM72_TRIUA
MPSTRGALPPRHIPRRRQRGRRRWCSSPIAVIWEREVERPLLGGAPRWPSDPGQHRQGAQAGAGEAGASRHVLREYGNMSGATIAFVLDELRRRRSLLPEWGAMLAFGPGVSIKTMVLRCPR